MTLTDRTHTHSAPQDLRIERISIAHLPGALRLSQEAGWPHQIGDWTLTLSASEGVVVLDNDDVVGTALCTDFGQVASLNMIIVDARMRGRGLGRRLMEAVMALAGDREMRLVATDEGLPLYQKLGFEPTGKIAQHQGIAQAGAATGVAVSTGSIDDVTRLAAIDHAASGLERTALLMRIASSGAVLLADGGFAMLREFGRGKVLGPVVANDTATAQALIAEGARRCEGSFLRVDLPETRALGGLAASLGLAQVGGGTAMSLNPQPLPSSDYKTFALASQALG